MSGKKQKAKKNSAAKMPLYSIFSIISVIFFCTAVLILLDIAKTTYIKTLKGSGKATPAQKLRQGKTNQPNSFLRKLFVGFYLVKGNLENANDQAVLKENEIKAAELLKKYAKAQQIYMEHYGHYAANATELIIEENGKYTIIDPELKVLNASYSKDNPTDGYYYVEIGKNALKSHGENFFLSAIPAQYGISGLNTFCIFNQSGQTQMIKKNNGGKPVFEISAADKSWENM